MLNVLSNCCNLTPEPPQPPVVERECEDCFALSKPYINYKNTVGPCNEQFSVAFASTTNCTSVEYSVIKADPAFYDCHFVGNVLYGRTHPNYAIPGIHNTYKILVRGVCKGGTAKGYSAQSIVEIPILDRCLGKNCLDGCDPCTGLCGPQASEIIVNPTTPEITIS